MTCLLDPILDGIFTGDDAQKALDQINERREEEDQPGRITTPFPEMDAETRRKVLYMITDKVDWSSDYEPVIEWLDDEEWGKFIKGNPGICSPRETA